MSLSFLLGSSILPRPGAEAALSPKGSLLMHNQKKFQRNLSQMPMHENDSFFYSKVITYTVIEPCEGE